MTVADPRVTARFLGAFFDELAKWGVQNVVISPGSRSTPLSMTAYELSCRAPQRMSTYVDIDERGAAFLALGMAKASGRPAALVCSSGTAIANYYPAILEAESSRVPLIVLTADRPPQLQGLGAPQTCDQSHAYGTHVRAYRGMPLPADDEGSLRFARQAAREACIAALGSCESPQNQGAQSPSAPIGTPQRLAGACFGGPVHLNFPFDEPLKPDVTLPDLFDAGIPCAGSAADSTGPEAKHARNPQLPTGVAQVRGVMEGAAAAQLARELLASSVLLLAGEGSCATYEEAQRVLAFARAFAIPVLADPLSGLRSLDDPLVIGNYDSVLQPGGISPDEALNPQVIVRFGRYPVSKRATQWARAREDAGVLQVVVDPLETRDTNAATTVFVRMKPADFAQSMERALRREDGPATAGANDLSFANAWQRVEEAAAKRIAAVDAGKGSDPDGFEGAYVRRVLELAPAGSCLFAANSMSVRAVDTFYLKGAKQLIVLANRGLNGIDGTVSTAIGASRCFGRTTLITGDLTMLHDLNSLALQRELRVQRQLADIAGDANRTPEQEDKCNTRETDTGAQGITIVLLNNNGGAIFDMLPQKSQEAYFERLFLTPQDVDFQAAVAAFGVPYSKTATLAEFNRAYRASLDVPGISFIEVPVPLQGLRERYADYW
ncbi:2-succinyl-5-enolpyruvyl-6-hydroxy-3-cyclohexene-1-carboxylic-acid synthase [uncultured Senegalimassilia sp.]|uniref:2-succinyl-5-enolpyruvyl-6-hydroxy-3- cyclohexene-1-carboxylic-acid synthase n=1 Tax=uncultured Senegalimassilia sp. TaxID=1714350 RepID=UPI0025D71D54|nr:2-succinyl-5-enolpyruvyl-6-hydroxy-3-cyclohexene-1-carboxylic-acid synthase [uncultured Senegalimassilia sp.]